MRPVFALMLVLLVCGCSPRRDVAREGLVFRVSDAIDCRPGADVERIRLTALGDFPAADALIADLRVGEPWRPVDSFPPETRRLTAQGLAGSAAWGAGSVAVFEGDAELLLLPFGRSCPVADPALTMPPGSAAAVLPNGSVVLVGGRSVEVGAGVGTRRLLRLAAGTQLVEHVDEAMVEPRQYATATASGSLVVVAGGSLGDSGPAYDTFEVYDDASRSLLRRGALIQRRRDHGAVRLADGGVLLFGGVGVAGADASALASAERIDPLTGLSRAVGELPAPRVAPSVARLDDGTILIAAGHDASGLSTTQVWAYDSVSESFSEVTTPSGEPLELSPCITKIVPIAGARAVAFGDACVSTLTLLRRLPRYLPDGVVIEAEALPMLRGLPELEAPVGVGLPDGRLLLEGGDGDSSRAFLIDIGRGHVHEVEASRVPRALLELGDGAVLELGAEVSSLRRDLLTTPFDNPPATLLGGLMDGLAFDRPGSFRADGGRFISERDDARVDLPGLSFADVRVRLEVPSGSVDLLLLQAGRAPRRLNVLDRSFGPSLCEVERVDEAPVELTRRGDELEIRAGGDTKICVLPGLAERLGLAIVASRGASLGGLEITRLGGSSRRR
ncbi:MAG: hypothetical protein GXP55_03380 [Deltaproteobacteria bacterium]|nr:hypothetical protein [Deltaproteobacteria bacterium]